MRLLVTAIVLMLVYGCSVDKGPTPTFHADNNPENLSDWGMISATNGTLVLNDGVVPFDLATPLFSDYAKKLRTVWIPAGQQAEYHETQSFNFPVGTVITKTFYYPQGSSEWDGIVTTGDAAPIEDNTLPLAGLRLIETRILVHRSDGWAALPYVWNDAQTDAVLKRAGAVKRMTLWRDADRMEEFAYIVPNTNQCAGCHATDATTKAILPIGPKSRHLNKSSAFQPGINQIDHWVEAGLLTGTGTGTGNDNRPKNADWRNLNATTDARARAYLDINCSHCHNPNGPADTSGLDLEPGAEQAALGLCKPPIAAGGGTGGHPYDIVPGRPENSILVFRMATTDPAAMMPELGRAVAHEEGVALIADWIAQMDGGCG